MWQLVRASPRITSIKMTSYSVDSNFKIYILSSVILLDAPRCGPSCFGGLSKHPQSLEKEQAILLAQNPSCRVANRTTQISRSGLVANDGKDHQLLPIFFASRWLIQQHSHSWKSQLRRSQRPTRPSQSQTCQTASIRRRSKMPRTQLSRKVQCGLLEQFI